MSDTNRITREDLESKFRALQADLQGRVADKRQSLVAVASAAGAVVVIFAYLFGRRSGRRRASRIQIRRF